MATRSSRVLTLSATIAVFAMTGPLASADDTYPNRPVRIVVSFSAGGPTDIVGRVMAQKLSELFGQQFFVVKDRSERVFPRHIRVGEDRRDPIEPSRLGHVDGQKVHGDEAGERTAPMSAKSQMSPLASAPLEIAPNLDCRKRPTLTLT